LNFNVELTILSSIVITMHDFLCDSSTAAVDDEANVYVDDNSYYHNKWSA